MIMTKTLKRICLWLFSAALLLSAVAVALVKLPVQAAAGEFAMEAGASVRLDDPSGIRFTTKVDQAFIDEIEQANPDKEITFGTEIKPEGKSVTPVDIKQTVWADESTETTKYFKAVLANIPEAQYLTELTATAYYAVDGVKTYVKNPQTRSIAYVASGLLAAGDDGAALVAIVDAVIAQISLVEEDFALKVGDSKKLTVEGGENLVVKFASDNEAVATVDAEGKVSAIGAGTANITATLGSRTDSVAVTVGAAEKKLHYDFEDGVVGQPYDTDRFTAKENSTCFVTNIQIGAVDGTQSLAFNFDGVNDGGPTITIKNTVLQDFYNAFGSMSFTLTNNGAKFHEGYYTTKSGNYRFDIAAKSSMEITVIEAHMKELIDNNMDFVYTVNNAYGTALYEGCRFEYYLDNIHAPNLNKVVKKNTVLSADEMLGKSATLKSFAVYKDDVLVSETDAESYTFTENGAYTFECVQSIEGYEDSTVKGTVQVMDAVFDNTDEWFGDGKLVNVDSYSNVTAANYLGATMLRMESSGNYPRVELNKAKVEEFLTAGKTFTLVYRFGDVDGNHKSYFGQGDAHISKLSGSEFAEISITPEKWEEIKNHADFATMIPFVTFAHVEGGGGGEGSDPFTMYLAGYKLS